MRKLLLLAVLFGGALYAYAGPTQFEFVAWSDNNWQNGYPYEIAPYPNPTGQVLAVMCDDYYHGGQPGDIWQANISDLGTGNISLARFNNIPGPNALYPLMLYNEAGWLLLQTQTQPTSQWQSINYAVWYIFDPSQTPCNGPCQMWVADAQTSIKGLPQSYFDDVYIITPVNQHDPDPNSMQEFMAIGTNSGLAPGLETNNSATVPEPGTLVLLGTGVLALFRRRLWN